MAAIDSIRNENALSRADAITAAVGFTVMALSMGAAWGLIIMGTRAGPIEGLPYGIAGAGVAFTGGLAALNIISLVDWGELDDSK